MTKSVPIITVDGPGGAGKGAVCKQIAETLSWHLLDSGMLYRLLALSAINHHVAFDNEAAIEVMASALDVRFSSVEGQEGIRAFLEGDDVTAELRSEDVGMAASKVAAIASARLALLSRQRVFAELPGLVADGRDMGTVVFEHAPLKIYLTASVAERAKRRYKQLLDNGQSGSLARLTEAIEARDRADMYRAVSPLRPAGDALILDSTTLSIDQVCETIISEAKSRSLI
ncbi:MAG: (d)CMP kinase [Pseudomonadales bacterium]|nr:(d)CMP kinase [Pseudomonadales bacterium]